MPSSALLNPPVALLACYNPSHVVDSFDFHAEHIAFLERSRLLHKNPLPSSALATSRLSPPCPLPPVHFSQQLHRDMASDEDEFFRAAHISLAEFTLLHAYLYNAILASQNHRETASPHVHLVESQLTPADQLLLWLFHLAGDRTVQLSSQFGHHHPSTVFRYVDHITFCINTVLVDIIAWPTAEQRRLMYGMMSVCHEAVAVLDGTHCAVQAPSALNNTYYSGYKHKHTNNYLVCVDYLGVILSVEGAYPGRTNDREVYNGCDLNLNINQYLSEHERILADGGFVGGTGLLVPLHKKFLDRAKNERTKVVLSALNKEFTANRLIVEDVFGWLKARACILDTAWKRRLDKQEGMFRAACRLHNFTRLVRIDHALHESSDHIQ